MPLASNKCLPTAGRLLMSGTPAGSNSSWGPIPLTNRRWGDEIAPADKITSFLALTRYLFVLSDVETCTPIARGTTFSVEKRIFSPTVFVTIFRFCLLRTSGVRYAAAEELPRMGQQVVLYIFNRKKKYCNRGCPHSLQVGQYQFPYLRRSCLW